MLIESGADVDAEGNLEGFRTPLEVAAWEGDVESVRLLIDHSADIGDAKAFRAMYAAAGHNGVDRIEAIASYGVQVPASIWVYAGDSQRALRAVDSGSINTPDARGLTPLQAACKRFGQDYRDDALDQGGKDLATELVHAGASIDVFSAAAMNDVGSLRQLLDDDPLLVEGTLSDGSSPPWYSANAGAVATTQLLLERGADANDTAALIRAARVDRTDILKVLFDHGAEVTDDIVVAIWWRVKDTSALALALENGGNGAAMGSAFSPGFAAIHWTAWAGNEAAVELLLSAGADPNVPSPAMSEDRPLHFATSSEAVARQLLAAGADPRIRNQNGLTPEEKARAEGNIEVAEVMAI